MYCNIITGDKCDARGAPFTITSANANVLALVKTHCLCNWRNNNITYDNVVIGLEPIDAWVIRSWKRSWIAIKYDAIFNNNIANGIA